MRPLYQAGRWLSTAELLRIRNLGFLGLVVGPKVIRRLSVAIHVEESGILYTKLIAEILTKPQMLVVRLAAISGKYHGQIIGSKIELGHVLFPF